MRAGVDGCGAVVLAAAGDACVGGGGVNVNVGWGVWVAVNVGETGTAGVNDATGVSPCEEGWNGVGVGEEFGA